jgi:hypothetical protein
MIQYRMYGAVLGMVGSAARAALLGMALLGAGCDGQADPSYRGEPLVSVGGQVEAPLSAGPLEVGVLWLTTAGDLDVVCTGEATTASGEPSACVEACGAVTCPGLETWGDCAGACSDVTGVIVEARTSASPFIRGGVAQTTPAVGEFPARFSLDILEPPPESVLIGSTTGEQLAVGEFVALDPAGEPWVIDFTQPVYPGWLLGGSETHVLVYAPEPIPATSLWAEVLGVPLSDGYHLLEVTPADDGGNPTLVPDTDVGEVQLTIAPPDTIAWPL